MSRDGTPVAITLLGGVAVRYGGDPVRPPSSRAIELLAYLTAHSASSHSRQHLAAVFWPDSTEAQARTNLRRELHNLRTLVRDDSCLDVSATSLAWRDHEQCTVDVRTFLVAADRVSAARRAGNDPDLVKAGQEALAAYGGPLLPGVYDDWALEVRDALLRRCLKVCDEVSAVLAHDDLSGALDVSRRRIQLEPLEEMGYRQLMELQLAAGDRAGAMTTYHHCASMLEEHLGVSPTAETSATLRRAIGATSGPNADAMQSAVRAAPTSSTRELVGRDGDLDTIRAHWDAARAGQPALVVVSGDPGVGKSRLVAEIASHVRRNGDVVATSRCFSSSGAALSPVAEWLRTPEITTARTSLEPAWRTEVERLVPNRPANGLPTTHATSDRAMVDSWQRHRFFQGLVQAVTAVERPILLVLDDLHWCDMETIAWVSFLLATANERPILVLATARIEPLESNSDLQQALAEMRSLGMVSEIELQPLGLAETTVLATRMFGHEIADGDASLLHATSGGYPLYVVEAARTLAEAQRSGEVSRSDLTLVLEQRLAQATPEARNSAALAAALGRDFRLELLVEASDLDEATVVRAVDELWRRRLLRQVGRGYDFTHDLLRDAAYVSAPPAHRWLAHRRLAQALELLYANQVDEVAAVLAEQYDRGGRAERALPFYQRAAAVASGLFANAEALRLLRRCLAIVAEMPQGRERDVRELEVRQAMSAPLNASRGYVDPELRETLRRSVDLAGKLDRPDVQLVSLVGLWAGTFVQGDITDSHALAMRALELGEKVPELTGQAHFAAGGSTLSLGRPDVAVRHLDLAYDLSLGAVSLAVGTRPEVHARAWSAHAWWLLGYDENAATACADSLERAREGDHPYTLAVALAYAGITAQLRNDTALLDETLTELTQLCRRYSFAYYSEWALVLSGWKLGNERGVARIKVGITHLKDIQSHTRMPYWLTLLAQTQHAVGEVDAALATLDAARISAAQHDDKWWLPEVMREMAALSDQDEAVSLLREAHAIAVFQASPVLARRCVSDLIRRGATAPATPGNEGRTQSSWPLS